MSEKEEKFPDPKDIEKEISEFLSKKFGGRVKLISPVVLPQEASFEKEEEKEEEPPKEKKLNFDAEAFPDASDHRHQEYPVWKLRCALPKVDGVDEFKMQFPCIERVDHIELWESQYDNATGDAPPQKYEDMDETEQKMYRLAHPDEYPDEEPFAEE